MTMRSACSGYARGCACTSRGETANHLRRGATTEAPDATEAPRAQAACAEDQGSTALSLPLDRQKPRAQLHRNLIGRSVRRKARSIASKASTVITTSVAIGADTDFGAHGHRATTQLPHLVRRELPPVRRRYASMQQAPAHDHRVLALAHRLNPQRRYSRQAGLRRETLRKSSR